ncbi:hypothetical protein GCM10023321_31740 [Pseudonocardia eucalypti]|uniref:Uncharacterized protein n=1 Tax=Pseudonocardia eucalypti TaxID=648755 RepID=A0ABP9Q339_9PSEU|nr:hypothetical protein [Pseudonocardia eucalypti]
MNARRRPERFDPERFDQLASTMALRTGLALGDLDGEQLWLRYAAMGGSLSRHTLSAALDCTAALTAMEHNLAAHALNEHLMDIAGLGYPVAYAAELDPSHDPH